MADLGFKGCRVIITGGTSGIGLGIAEAFLQEGAVIGLIARSVNGLSDTYAKLKARFADADIFFASADVSDEASVKEAINELVLLMGGLDHLVVNAGIDGEMGALLRDISAENFCRVLDVNVVGAFFSAKAAVDFLEKSHNATVTFIGSDSGFVANAGMLAYNASKGAIVQLTRALSVELYDLAAIRVNSVCPSIVDTPMARKGLGVNSLDDAPFPVSEPKDIAYLVLSLASPHARAVNGVSLLADYGYHARSSFPA
ncbi:SDR family oxidoreductase [Bartonella sp. M0283]|uniref:SDR family NAD(P)-dependent oxidoreductase n=1 Tax=Bartonella sp. M0283 TaxID=2751016 RepID=UPI0018DAFF10|nr:SDR family oxidoreductase [Bartonella sp. M0283]MBI0162387.1 SDR family oxidoreductase [Bartonella sp. M0283]